MLSGKGSKFGISVLDEKGFLKRNNRKTPKFKIKMEYNWCLIRKVKTDLILFINIL